MKYLFLLLVLTLSACNLNMVNNKIICPKVSFNNINYCSIPFVEMQANYNNLNNHIVAVAGIISVSEGLILLVDPSTTNYDIPQPYNTVEVKLEETLLSKIANMHGKHVLVFGKFKAKNIGSGEWPDLIAHAIENATIIEWSP